MVGRSPLAPRFLLIAACGVSSALSTARGRAEGVDGAALLRLLGPHAKQAFAPPASPGLGALVRLPDGMRGIDVGLKEVAPGIARLWGQPSDLLAFADAHPALFIEIVPPLHTLLDTAAKYVSSGLANQSGLDGTGVTIGIADTGIDVTHSDFLDDHGHTRIAWVLDLSVPPIGLHVDLEQRFGSTDASGKVVSGAVWSAQDIDARIASGAKSQLPQDQEGHGTLVASCAAGSGPSKYRGIAPKATLVVARITGDAGSSIGNDELLRGVDFLFDRADLLHQPVVVNLSIGTDFGPHDGRLAWEETLAMHVGTPMQPVPGHVLVAAAGNSGSIADVAVHQSVHVSSGSTMHVPIATGGAAHGGVQVWVAMHAGALLRVGLDGPSGTWIAPVGEGDAGSLSTGDADAAVYNGSRARGSPVPRLSLGAVVLWENKWPAGTYNITLTGSGTADLYLQGTGDASIPGVRTVGFTRGVRESTVNLPATSASVISVGCSINKPSWHNMHSVDLGLLVPVLDDPGGLLDPSGATRDAIGGEPCWFSSAGPTLTGVQKPEIMAPGAAIVGAMSGQALPPSSASIFTSPNCPDKAGTGVDPNCQQIDATHAVSFGTSFSAPIVAGVAAILLQHDPTLTQDGILAALQGGAHPLRGKAAFEDQAGVGEADVLGAIAAADRMRDPVTALPAGGAGWLTLGADAYLADGSTTLQAIIELRSAVAGTALAPPADGFDRGRLGVYALVDDAPRSGAVQSLDRRGPGVWVATLGPPGLPAGLGGSRLTVGVTFDGRDIVERKSIPIATDVWNAEYPPTPGGGCAVGRTPRAVAEGETAAVVAAFLVLVRARRRSPSARKARLPDA